MRQIDWNGVKERAEKMTEAEIDATILDCNRAINCKTEDEGYYYDEISIYRTELKRRKKEEPKRVQAVNVLYKLAYRSAELKFLDTGDESDMKKVEKAYKFLKGGK